MKRVIKILIFVFVVLFVFIGMELYLLAKPTSISSSDSPDGTYTVELIETESATFFGPQKVEVILKKGEDFVAKKETIISNDGKALDDSNWTVNWCDQYVEVTIHGEEQSDETIKLYK